MKAISFVLLLCALLSVNGCSSGGGSRPPPSPANEPHEPTLPSSNSSEPAGYDIPPPNTSDGRSYQTVEYTGHWGLDGINAEPAYQRGYFGQGVTIAVVDPDGIDTSHPDLAGRITGARDLNNDDTDVSSTNRVAHGTYVSLLAAGAKDNSGGPFPIAGTLMRSRNFHGVAPQASVMPIQLVVPVHPDEAIRYAATSDTFVVNLSFALGRQYWGRLTDRDGIYSNITNLPYFRPLIAPWLKNLFSKSAAALSDRNTIVVFSAGNDGWNSPNSQLSLCGRSSFSDSDCTLGRVRFTAEEFIQKFEWLPNRRESDRLSDRPIPFRDIWGTDCGQDDCAEYNSPGGWKEAPQFEPHLLGKWLVVVATRENRELASWSNACGATRSYCLAAPGVGLTLGPESQRSLSGTSFAAALASGALAVLRSRLPAMPAESVLALLLYSADPVGSRIDNPDEPDPVYGWGHLNLGRAITRQGALRLLYPVILQNNAQARYRGVPLRDVRLTLSPAFAHMASRLGGVQLAVGGVGSAYYNMELGRIIDIASWNLPVQGHAATDMLEPAGNSLIRGGAHGYGLFVEAGREPDETLTHGLDITMAKLGRWRLAHHLCDTCRTSAWQDWSPRPSVAVPFFAYREGAVSLQMLGMGLRPFAVVSGQEANAPWRQYGLSWRRQEAGFYDISAELSRIDEGQSIWGTKFSTLGRVTGTTTRQLRLFGSVPLFESWRGLVGYEYLSASISADNRSLFSITGLKATGWSLGVEGRGIFQNEDTVRFSAQQKTAIRSGQIRINHVVVAGAGFVDAFYRGQSQSLLKSQTVTDLYAPDLARYAFGYSLPVTSNNKTRVALGLEYEGEYGTSAVSFALRRDL